jgi:hypothetical protein
MLQPGDLFDGLPSEDIPQLIRKKNDKFWVFPIKDYSNTLKTQIQKSKKIPEGSKSYLKGLIDFMDDKIDARKLENLYSNSGKQIKIEDLIKNFGELLGPYFAIKFLKSRDIKNIVFPIRQNYEVFDFFIKNEHYYGFSSKALTGGSNTMAPGLVVERLKLMNRENEFREYKKEIKVLENLTNHAMYEGIVVAFGDLLSESVTSKGFDISSIELRKMFKGVDFKGDSIKIEKNKDAKISDLSLSKPTAYTDFLNQFIIESTKVPLNEKKGYQTGKLSYTSTNVVYGMTKFIASSDFNFDFIINQTFQDLNIVKMGMNKDGVPIFKMVSTVPAEGTVTNGNYAFRNKAYFAKVNDKLGLQL